MVQFQSQQIYKGLGVHKTLTLGTNDGVCSLAISGLVSGNFLYAGLYTTPGKVVKINLQTLKIVATRMLATGENKVSSLAVSRHFLYAGLNTTPGKVVKIDLNHFLGAYSTRMLATGEDGVNALAVSGHFLYAGCCTDPSKVVQINLNNFSGAYLTRTLDPGDQNLSALAIKGNDLYVGIWVTGPGKLIKIDLNNFLGAYSTLTLGTDESEVVSLAVLGNLLFVGAIWCDVLCIDLNNYTVVSTITLPSADSAVALTVGGDYLYAGCFMIPGKVFMIGPGPGTIMR
jgi:hypothetical protein